jgi:hypothetical protein
LAAWAVHEGALRLISTLFTLLLVASVVAVAQAYYHWTTQAESPFDDFGIELHGYMPAPIQSWGCGRLKARFEGKTLPPHGCQDLINPSKWRKI